MTRRTLALAAGLSLISILILRLQTERVLAVFDFAYFTDIAIRIQQGSVPYRDIPLFASPGSYIELAALFSLFGRSYVAIFVLMAVKSTAVCFILVYLVSHRVRGLDLRSRLIVYGTISWVSVLNVYALFFQPFYDADAVVAVLLSASLVVTAWTLQGVAGVSGKLWHLAAGASILAPFLYKQTFGTAWVGIIALAGVGAFIGAPESRRKVVYMGCGLGGATLLFGATLTALGALHQWKYWTVDYPLTIRNSSYFALLGGLGEQERVIIGVVITAGALAATARLRRGMRDYSIVALIAAPPIVWTLAFVLGGAHSLDAASQVSQEWMPLLFVCWLTASVATAFRSGAWSIWDTILCASSATLLAGLISQGFVGSSHSVWPIVFLNIALVGAALARSQRLARYWLIPGGIILTWVVFAVLTINTLGLTRYVWIARSEEPSTAPASLAWVRTPGTFLADASTVADLFETYSRLGPTTVFPGEEPVAFLTGIVPDSDVSSSDPTTNPSYGDLAGWLDRNSIKYLILRRSSQIPDDQRLANVDRQLDSFVRIQQEGPYEVYVRR